MNQSIRVRFAPSPTGYLHVGGARSLFFNWLFAKKQLGKLILRIEDTDQSRSTRQSEEKIISDIQRLNLDFQEGPEPLEGPFSPYRQSERLKIYSDYAKSLQDKGLAYPCFCSEDLLTQKRQAALKMGKTPHYDGTCARLTPEQIQKKYAQGEKSGLRFRAFHKTYVLEDHVRGRVEFKEGMVGDFFITRTPTDEEQKKQKDLAQGVGFPVYNFCCVIDDHLMEISHVIRAEEHLSNTVRQLMIYEAFGWGFPEFAHIALVLGADRQKLSKRNGDSSVYEYLDRGYLPEALLNFLVLLGWWPEQGLKTKSGHPEILNREEMINAFNLKGLQKAAGVFDIQKLNWMNGYYIHHMSLSELAHLARPFFEKEGLSIHHQSQAWFESLLEATRSEVTLLSDFPKVARIFLEPLTLENVKVEEDAKAILRNSESLPVIEKWIDELQKASEDLKSDEIIEILKRMSSLTGLKGKALFMPIRAVTTGKTHGPELKQILPLLRKKAVLEMIELIRKQI